jgi:hypothetical protein
MALAPESSISSAELEALQRAAYGRSTPEERAAAETRLAELQEQNRDDVIQPPPLVRVRPWWAAIAAAAVLCVLALGTASFAVWSTDSRRVFDREPTAEDATAGWTELYAPGATARWLGEFEGRNVFGMQSPDGTVCVAVPLGGGGISIACADAFEFWRDGVNLVSRTIEGDFALACGVRWGEYP